MTLLLSLACLENDPNLIPPLCLYLPRIFQGMCGMCWSPLISEPYLLPCCLLLIDQAQSHVQAPLSPLQKSRCILSCLKSFHQKNRQAAHKRTYFRQKKNRPIPRTWTSACLLPVSSDRFLPPPKLSGGLPAAMVLLPRTEDGDAAQATKLLLLYTKDNNRNSRRPWVPNRRASSL